MSRRNRNFQNPQDSNIYSPEYIKLQREEVLSKHRKDVEELQSKKASLQIKIQELESTLKGVFSSEHKRLESLENEQKTKADLVETVRSGLMDAEKELQKKIVRVDLEFAKRQQELDEKEATLKSLEEGIVKDRDSLKQDQLLLAEREASLQDDLGMLAVSKAGLESDFRKLIELSESTDDRSRNLNKKEAELNKLSSELSARRDFVLKREKEIQASLDDLKSRESLAVGAESKASRVLREVRVAQERLESESVQLKSERGRLSEWESRLNVHQQTFNNEYARRKRDLDEREARIKSLEKEFGGK